MRLIAALLAVGLALALVGGACGGDDDGGDGSAGDGAASTTAANGDRGGDGANGANGGDDNAGSGAISLAAATPKKAKYLEQANTVCTEERREIPDRTQKFEGEEAPQSGSNSYGAGVVAVLLPTFEAEVEGIAKLGAPAGDEQQVEAMLSAQQQGIEETAADENLRSIDDFAPYFTEAAKLMRDYGLVYCAVTPEP